ncbi:unnamed protein product [Rhizophagus irregularis]|nr:unnamed protein product [Rhizophagus irregularis]
MLIFNSFSLIAFCSRPYDFNITSDFITSKDDSILTSSTSKSSGSSSTLRSKALSKVFEKYKKKQASDTSDNSNQSSQSSSKKKTETTGRNRWWLVKSNKLIIEDSNAYVYMCLRMSITMFVCIFGYLLSVKLFVNLVNLK